MKGAHLPYRSTTIRPPYRFTTSLEQHPPQPTQGCSLPGKPSLHFPGTRWQRLERAFPLLLSPSSLQVALQSSGLINEVILFNSVCVDSNWHLQLTVHSLLPSCLPAAMQASQYPNAASMPPFASGKKPWFLAATLSLPIVALLHPSLSFHSTLMHKTECPTRKRAPAQAHLIWIKDVSWFSLFHKARENLHYPELGGRSMCVFFTRLSLGLFRITSLQSRSGCRFVLLSSEIQNSCAKFPLFLNSRDPLTASSLGQTLADPGEQFCLFAAHPSPSLTASFGPAAAGCRAQAEQ